MIKTIRTITTHDTKETYLLPLSREHLPLYRVTISIDIMRPGSDFFSSTRMLTHLCIKEEESLNLFIEAKKLLKGEL